MLNELNLYSILKIMSYVPQFPPKPHIVIDDEVNLEGILILAHCPTARAESSY